MDAYPAASVAKRPAVLWARRRINDAGIALIKSFEGLRLTAYRCPAGLLTIGYGHTRDVEAGMNISPEQAEDLLHADLASVERGVGQLTHVPLSDNQFAALCCFAFNVGLHNFERSTLLTLLNRGWYDQVPAQLTRWNKVGHEPMGGLARRRMAEVKLWNQSDDFSSDPIQQPGRA